MSAGVDQIDGCLVDSPVSLRRRSVVNNGGVAAECRDRVEADAFEVVVCAEPNNSS